MFLNCGSRIRVFSFAVPVLILSFYGAARPLAAQDAATNTPDAVTNAPVVTGWVARIDGPAQGPNDPASVASDSNGNVFVTGSIAISSTVTEALTTKYDATGKVVWKAWLSGPGGFAAGKAIKVDSAGN